MRASKLHLDPFKQPIRATVCRRQDGLRFGGTFGSRLAVAACTAVLVILPVESLKAVYEEKEYEVASYSVSAGLTSFTVRAWNQAEDGGGGGLMPANPASESGFVRLYNNGRLVDNQAIPFLIEPGQLINDVTVSGDVTAGSVSVRFINGYKQLNPGGAPALPQRTFLIYHFENYPSPTPTPTPTPFNDPNTAPRVSWDTQPIRWDQDSSMEVQTLRETSLRAFGNDIDSRPANQLRLVRIEGPRQQPLVTFSIALRSVSGTPPVFDPENAGVTFEVYSEADGVRYPGFRYPGVYTFTAQAFDASGRTSREITMTITATDAPTTPQSINAMIVSGASHPGDVFTLGGAETAQAELRGGIFTLGTTALSGAGTGPLSFTPDNEYLTGQKVPPFIPWLYDVREVTYRIQARTAGGIITPMRSASGAEAQRMLANPNKTPYPARTPGGGRMLPAPAQRPPSPVPTPTPVPTAR